MAAPSARLRWGGGVGVGQYLRGTEAWAARHARCNGAGRWLCGGVRLENDAGKEIHLTGEPGASVGRRKKGLVACGTTWAERS